MLRRAEPYIILLVALTAAAWILFYWPASTGPVEVPVSYSCVMGGCETEAHYCYRHRDIVNCEREHTGYESHGLWKHEDETMGVRGAVR